MDNVQKHNICTNVPSSQTFRSYKDFPNAIALAAQTLPFPHSPFTCNLAGKKYKRVWKRLNSFEGHTHVSCFVEVTAFSDWLVTSCRDQRNQSRVSYANLMVDRMCCLWLANVTRMGKMKWLEEAQTSRSWGRIFKAYELKWCDQVCLKKFITLYSIQRGNEGAASSVM
jgi:hypothetical protein